MPIVLLSLFNLGKYFRNPIRAL